MAKLTEKVRRPKKEYDLLLKCLALKTCVSWRKIVQANVHEKLTKSSLEKWLVNQYYLWIEES